MLQKLEDAYLAILRAVVIIASGILLVGVVIFGLGTLRGLGDGPSDEINSPDVAAKSVIEKMTISDQIQGADGLSEDSTTKPAKKSDPNQEHFDSSAKVIVDFVVKNSGGEESPDQKDVSDVTKSRANAYKTEELRAAYAKGFSDSVSEILGDSTIIGLAKSTSSIDVVNQLLNAYTGEFNSQIMAEQERVAEEQQEHAQAKLDSASNLYIAGACFGLFLLIVFLSIFIKIERNLRQISVRNSVGA